MNIHLYVEAHQLFKSHGKINYAALKTYLGDIGDVTVARAYIMSSDPASAFCEAVKAAGYLTTVFTPNKEVIGVRTRLMQDLCADIGSGREITYIVIPNDTSITEWLASLGHRTLALTLPPSLRNP